MTTEEQIKAIGNTLEQLTGVVAALAGVVASHDRQIGTILNTIEKHDAQIAKTDAQIAQTNAAVADLSRQLQAYLTRTPPQ